ncbi:MAG: type VI secretion system tip protein VgrG [Polyangiaceae bacterium]|nr:type VI secretion system tip protein VgrG [Polyangiaceae bacterium]
MALQAFSGVERMSRSFHFKLRVETPIQPHDLDAAVLGSSATVVARAAGHGRQIHGLVTGVRREDTHLPAAPSHAVYTLDLHPHAWLLGRRVGSRIFQNVSVVDVINEVLDAYSLPRRWALERSRPPRPYITQYEESDWDFVTRLAAENGIFFHFHHPSFDYDPVIDTLLGEADAISSAEVVAAVSAAPLGPLMRHRAPREELVFSDQATYAPISGGGALPFLHSGAAAAGEDYVLKLSSRRALRANKSEFREYDWRRPSSAILSQLTRDPQSLLAGEPDDLEIYEHHQRDHEADWADAYFESSRILDAARRHAQRASGESSSVRLATGHQFLLEGHHGGADGRYLVTTVRHAGSRRPSGEVGCAYSNRFEAVPAEVRYLPARPPRKTIQACLTATVAGVPDEEEIHVNQHGQIKVKFHWDRSDEAADPTCWIRCMHPWAGNGWGFQFVPRVGMEAVVSFEGGDPDRPLVLGCVYNSLLPEPFTLPGQKTRSGIRTQSTPQSDGFNELSFEDAANNEQIYLRAQRDFDSVVQRDRSANVNRDDSEHVHGSQRVTVGGSRGVDVQGDHTIVTHGSLEHETIKTHSLLCEDLRLHALTSRVERIGELDSRVVGGMSALTVRGCRVENVLGDLTQLVGHGGDGATWSMDVRGPGLVHAASLDLSAREEIVLRVGESFIRIASGQIEVVSPTLILRGKDARVRLSDGDCKVKANGKFQVVSGEVVMVTDGGASMGLRSQARLDGAQVLLNSPSQATDSLEAIEVSSTSVKLNDRDGNPLPFARFQVRFDDGTVVTGVTDADGQATVEGEGNGQIEFPDHTDPEEGGGGGDE